MPVRVLIRPRAADFVYSEDEVRIMERDIVMAKKAGAAGVVIGALTGNAHPLERPKNKKSTCKKS